eukprot:TRINITY_DN323_c0_g2_i1.p1 TRINITY_DN323_c0_g2~~TRINITY_DN323_c0_g2_i1.p1  ORF type:complete len:390 (+),score=160.12 TRINITY_DN323_c0_g2_i1:59-1228(+)
MRAVTQSLSRMGHVAAAGRRFISLVERPHEPLKSKVQIRDRPHLPDSHNPLLPEFLASPAENEEFFKSFSVVGDADPAKWSTEVRKAVEEQLSQRAAVLLRNTPLRTGEDFSEFIRLTGWQTKGDDDFARAMQARSMTSSCISDYARTASDDHKSYTIEPHHEYHTVGFPDLILLFCQSCPEAGGEWPVGDGRTILKELRPDVVEKFERLGARYHLYYPSKNTPEGSIYNNWETNLLPTKEETENYLRDRGYEFEWKENDGLRYWQNFPAIRSHPKTGERVWFNQIHAHHKTFYTCHPSFVPHKTVTDEKKHWPVHCTYGDGTEIEKDVLDHIRQTVWKNCRGVTPQPGDLLIVDNWAALHGRISFPEGQRKVFAATVFTEEEDDEDDE